MTRCSGCRNATQAVTISLLLEKGKSRWTRRAAVSAWSTTWAQVSTLRGDTRKPQPCTLRSSRRMRTIDGFRGCSLMVRATRSGRRCRHERRRGAHRRPFPEGREGDRAEDYKARARSGSSQREAIRQVYQEKPAAPTELVSVERRLLHQK